MTLAAAALLLLATVPGAADASAPPPVHAVRAATPIHVDGVLSEPVWRSGNAVTAFTQRDPNEGDPPTERTEVRVAYDDDALYVGARMYDTAPDSIIARLTRRDASIPADEFAVYLDPYHDRRSGYYFQVNAGGTLYDGTLYNDTWSDDSWDAVWEARVRRDSLGWTAEMRIPYSQLRFRRGARAWGINFQRTIERRNELDYLVFQPKKGSGFVSRFPDLVGMDGVRPGRSIELLPYVTTKAEYLSHDPLDPFHDGSRYVQDAGADLRMRVGGNLTLNATANPDFGQVEVDPAVVNLSDVETYFQEKRPFFVDGATVFDFGRQGADSYWGFNWPEPTFFYSRRIGRAPQGSTPDDADFVNVPVGTTILGAAKLTGKLTPSWNFGTLHALTARETAEYQSAVTRGRVAVEPLTYYGVARGLREFKDRRQGLGLMATAVERRFEDPVLRDELNRSALMAGTDGWMFLDRDKTWVVSGWTAVSQVSGTAARITDLQQDPRHYYQRPDAGYLGVDPNATSLTGFGSRYWINKQKGSVICNAAAGVISPGFEVNDIGYMSRADVVNLHAGVGYKWTEPTRLRKSQDVIGAAFAVYDFQGNPTGYGLYTEGATEFSNNYSWNYYAAFNPRHVNNRATRGGPVMTATRGYELGTYFDTDSKAKLFYFVQTSTYQQRTANSWTFSLAPGIEWKPSSSLKLRIGPGYERLEDDAQYVDTYADPTAVMTYGNRYVFGHLSQTTVSAEVRLDWSFTPSLSLQLYAQPLISAGAYTDLKSLARGRSFAFDPYGAGGSTWDPATGTVDADGSGPAPSYTIGNPDFNFRSLRGNAVLRWEYTPGSTLFLVWTQTRTDEVDDGDLAFGHSVRSLARAQPDNIFLAKVSYYFSL